MKPKARYTFSGVESVSFTSYSISFRFSDGDSLDVDFPSSSGRKFIHEEIRHFLKWYGKDDRKQLEETSKVLIKLLEKKEEAEAGLTLILSTLLFATATSGITSWTTKRELEGFPLTISKHSKISKTSFAPSARTLLKIDNSKLQKI